MNRRLLLTAATLVASASLGSVATVGAAKPTAVAVPLVVSLSDVAGNGVLSDNGGEYTDREQNISAELLANTNGNFVFDTNDQPGVDGGRRLYLDFHGQATPFASTVAIPVDIFIGTLAVDLNAVDPSDNLQTMHADQTLQRRARMAWVSGNLQYSLRWDGPDNGHSFLNVHCDNDDGALKPRCTDWTVTPDGLAGLYSIPTKGKAVDTPYGSFDMPFTMTLRKK